MRDAAVKAVLDSVSGERLREDVEQLVAFGDRRVAAIHIGGVANHLRKRFLQAGFESEHVELIEFPFESRQHNVVCAPRQFPGSAILVGAHYDSESCVGDDAPGADDNASGVAAVLELARLLRRQALTADVVFVAFGAEEASFSGSRHLAQLAAARRWPLALMINVDQIGAPSAPLRVVVEYEMVSHQTPHNDVASRAFGALMMQMATLYTSLTPEANDIRDSDYMPFEAMGIPCVGAFAGGDNPRRHTPADTVATLDFDYMRQVVQMILATVLTLAR